MYTKIKEKLNKYNLEYIINEDNIELWRNGRTTKINCNSKNINKIEMEIEEYIHIFSVYSPDSETQLKENFPFYFEEPKYGDLICVKKLGEWVDVYQIRTFKEFRNGKIICFKDREEGDLKEIEYDFYSMSDGIRHPSTTFWFNEKQNHLTWGVLEKIMEENYTVKPRLKYIEED